MDSKQNGLALMDDLEPADLAGIGLEEGAVMHDPGAEAMGEEEIAEVAQALRLAEGRFGEGAGIGVILHDHGQALVIGEATVDLIAVKRAPQRAFEALRVDDPLVAQARRGNADAPDEVGRNAGFGDELVDEAAESRLHAFRRSGGERAAQARFRLEGEVDQSGADEIAVEMQADAVTALGDDPVIGRRLALAAIDLAGGLDEPCLFQIADDIGDRLRAQSRDARQFGPALCGVAAQEAQDRLPVEPLGISIVLAKSAFAQFHVDT
jgi:hypothetical protein